ncbi:CvfD/Ygs/GSP13 family RNA-binding post-transcriptional regulator [Lapidilactobacillus mulanensis]|uniref:CvfD/Ygs/GSP13 family RNA-binding post-transcriptional regulator n=1 Tax=Lapidilactobacillus mulanensis TaxID=2485999 RepID=A0ABW4DL91_9LACO|nr:CvfD/Ygs/GSP13 family RNA-binding post-transcriptional regulator [Lapidilactobacillus mulanensis]
MTITSYRIGDILPGTVTGIQPYGVFVLLDDQVQGLIHISECTSGYVDDLSQVIHIGDQVQVMVLDLDEFSQKLSLSLRSLANEPISPSTTHKKFFWTNQRVNRGYQAIAEVKDQWISEALAYFN